MRGERGFALVITLVITALLIALLAEFVNEVYVDTSHSHNFVASQQAAILAESGIEGGKQLLKYSAVLRMGQNYSSLTEIWAKPQSYDAGEGTVTISIEEESGKLNLNSATNDTGVNNPLTEVAKRLVLNLKLSSDLVDVLMDWVDTNDQPRPGGAESSYYSTLKAPYKAKNARLDSVEELGLLKGFTPEVLAKLRPLVTVYGNTDSSMESTAVNLNTAPREVLLALDDAMSEDLVQRILDYRKTSVIKIDTAKTITGLDTVLPKISTKVTYGGTVYRIHAEGKVRDSTSVAEAVVRIGGIGEPAVLYWREY
jgi:general secretion pathway protein K